MFKVISDMKAHWYKILNTTVIAISFCTGKKMIFALMLIITNHYGIKCLSNLLQLEQWNVKFKLHSDMMVLWYDLRNTIVVINF